MTLSAAPWQPDELDGHHLVAPVLVGKKFAGLVSVALVDVAQGSHPHVLHASEAPHIREPPSSHADRAQAKALARDRCSISAKGRSGNKCGQRRRVGDAL